MGSRIITIIALFAAVAVAGAQVKGAEFQAVVKSDKKQVVEDAVVALVPMGGEIPEPEKTLTAVMDQVDKEFVPRVLPVRTGTKVSFPNSDNILHHVYSFSKAKPFELPLYKGAPANPVVFDNPGVVVLGCNIHDWMKGYIVVLETPWFGKTGDKGKTLIKDVPPGRYKIFLWHPESASKNLDPAGEAAIVKDEIAKKEYTIKLKGGKKKSRAPDPAGVINY